jgi:hypothetical protein
VGRTPKNLPAIQDRRAEVVRLRAQGLTWDQVAERVGYANGSSALKAWRAAIKQKPDLAVTEIRAAERERLEAMDAELSRIIASPPAKTTAIGKTVVDPDTGEIVRDQQVVVSSIRARLAVGESYRKLVNADVPAPPAVAVVDNSTRILTQINEFRVEHGQQPYRVREPSGPPIPRDQAIAQARAALERERRTPEGGIIVPPGVAAEGAAAITAWVTTQQHYAKIAADATRMKDASFIDDVVDAEIVD